MAKINGRSGRIRTCDPCVPNVSSSRKIQQKQWSSLRIHELCRRLFSEFRWSIGGRPSDGFLLRGLQVRILLGSPSRHLTSILSKTYLPFWLTGLSGEPLSVPEMSLWPALAAALLRSAFRVYRSASLSVFQPNQAFNSVVVAPRSASRVAA